MYDDTILYTAALDFLLLALFDLLLLLHMIKCFSGVMEFFLHGYAASEIWLDQVCELIKGSAAGNGCQTQEIPHLTIGDVTPDH